MAIVEIDNRSPIRRELDERIAALPKLDAPPIPPDAKPVSLEEAIANLREVSGAENVRRSSDGSP